MSSTASNRSVVFAGTAPRPRPKTRAVRGRITERDVELAQFVADGLPNKEIAFRMGVTEQRTKTRLSDLYFKLDIRKTNPRVALALLVKLHGLDVGPAVTPREAAEIIQ